MITPSPNCPLNAVEFATAVSAQAKLFQKINGSWEDSFRSSSVTSDTSPITITPPQKYKMWFSDKDGNNQSQELVVDYTGLRSLMASYSESGWALTGPSTYNIGESSWPLVARGRQH